MSRLVIKVGTSTLTHGSGPPDESVIADLAAQLAAQRRMGRQVILVSSGAIRAGMARLGLTGRPRAIPQKQAAAAVGQGLLMETYARAFAPHGLTVAQILLTRDDLRERGRYVNARNTFAALLQMGVVPIVNENDTVAVDEIKFGDNDTLAALVASLIEADDLLLLSDVAGLYDRDPSRFADARLIPVVEQIDAALEAAAGGTRSPVGTGGMTTKLAAARICQDTGVRLIIADGRRPAVVADALAGRCGTRFVPRPARLRPRQRWLAFGGAPRGTVTVNDGARSRLTAEGKSLLPAGVTDASGAFSPGDLVRLSGPDGLPFASGIVRYSRDELEKIQGRRTSEIAEILGVTRGDEVVHRDDLVLDLGEA